MLDSEVKDINRVVKAKLVELYGPEDPTNPYDFKLVFGSDGTFKGIEVGKCHIPAEDLELAFV